MELGASDLELNHLSLPLFVTSQLEMFATLQWCLLAVLAFGALHTQHNLFSGLSLLSEDRLGLTTETLLFSVVTTSALSTFTLLRLLVLCHLVWLVALALLAKGASLFRHIHHLDDSWLSKKEKKKRIENKRKRHNCQLSKFINRTSKRQNRDSETQL